MTLQLVASLDDPLWTSEETDSPSCHGVCLGYTIGDDHLLLHAWLLCNAVMLADIVNVLVDFVCQHKYLWVLLQNLCQCCQLLLGIYTSGRVAW